MKEQKKCVPEIRFAGFTDDWEQRKLGEVVIIKDSARIPNSRWVTSGIPYIRSSDISNNDLSGVLFISNAIYEYYKSQTGSPEKGDVLFNGGGEIGKAILKQNSSPIYVQGGAILYARTSHSKSLLGIYLKVYFETNIAKTYIDIASAGGTIKHFTLKPAKNMPIFFPKIEEQTSIGNFFKQLDDTIALHRRNCIKFQNLKVAYLESIFSAKYIQNKDKNKNAWEQRKLGEIVEIVMGQSPNSGNYTNNPKDHILVQGNADIKNGKVFPRIWTTQITKIGKKNDLIMSVRAPVGDMAKTDYDVVLGRGVCAIKGNEFIYQILSKMKIDGYWNALSTGSTFDAINSNDIKKTLISIPKEQEEQTAIGNFFKQLDDTIALHQKELAKYQQIKAACLEKMFVK